MDNTKFLAGHPTMPINKQMVEIYTLACMAKAVRYGLGSKDPTPKQPLPIDFKKIDCSGHARGQVYVMTGGIVVMPDGSWNQLQWLEKQGYKHSSYAATLHKDNVVRICVSDTTKTKKTGHIWVTYQGQSYESWGGHGPGIRSADTAVLERIVTDVFAVA